jgi:hypothetical protein
VRHSPGIVRIDLGAARLNINLYLAEFKVRALIKILEENKTVSENIKIDVLQLLIILALRWLSFMRITINITVLPI